MSKRVFVFSSFVGLALLGFAYQMRSQSISRSPFVATFSVQNYSQDSGSVARSYTMHHAVRSDGSSSRETRWEGDAFATMEIVDVPQRQVFAVDFGARTVVVGSLSEESARFRSQRTDRRCEQFFPSCKAAEPIHGYTVYQIEIPAGGSGVRRVQWVSPELNWLPLREETYRDGKLTVLSEIKQIVAGEPPQSMFTTPAGFRQVDPATQLTEAAAARGAALTPGVVTETGERIRQREEQLRRGGRSSPR
jgi:hypothetical protein